MQHAQSGNCDGCLDVCILQFKLVFGGLFLTLHECDDGCGSLGSTIFIDVAAFPDLRADSREDCFIHLMRWI